MSAVIPYWQMHQQAFANGKISDLAEVQFRLTGAALYGKGVFTTIAIMGGEPFLWDKHWRRLSQNAALVGIDLSEHGEKVTRASLDALITANGVRDGRARVTFMDESPSAIWYIGAQRITTLVIVTADVRERSAGIRLGISPFSINSRSPLAGVKSCNYLENLLAFDEARERSFDEALRLNQRGEIASACMANVFWVVNERVFTPSVSTGCLAGTTREFLLEMVPVTELEADMAALHDAEAIFLTSAGLGIAEVTEFNGRILEPLPAAIRGLIEGSGLFDG